MELLEQVNKIVDEELDRLINSGALDIENIEKGDYLMPKILLKISIENSIHNLNPLSNKAKEAYDNLKHF